MCFAAGTPIRTPGGSKLIEEFVVGDLVMSRDEYDVNGPIEAKVVEEVFCRHGLVWHLHAGGQVIRTTAEHPFFVEGQGWVATNALRVGDRLLCEDGTTVDVEDLLDTGEWVTVYNLRVAEWHTYFVGCDEWGFSVWAHNQYDPDPAVNAARHAQVEADLIAAGVPHAEAAMLARLGAEPYTQGQVLQNAIQAGRVRQLYDPSTSVGDRVNGVGDIIRRMAQQDPGLDWAGATTLGPARPVASYSVLDIDVPIIGSREPIRVQVIRDAAGNPCYNCHSLSTGGRDVPGGPFSPISEPSVYGPHPTTGRPLGGGMARLLEANYELVPFRRDARPGDLVVFRDPQLPTDIAHSAPLTHVVLNPRSTRAGGGFDYGLTRLQTKNGQRAVEANMTLREVLRTPPANSVG